MVQLYKIVAYSLLFVSLVEGAEKRTYEDYRFAQKYLEKYHYFSSPHANHIYDMRSALEKYQQYAHIPITGQLDAATWQQMHKPRCGNADFDLDQQNGGLGKRYVLRGTYWDRKDLTYGFVNYGQDMSRQEYERITRLAFNFWSDQSGVTFTKISDVSKANLKIGFGTWKHLTCSHDFDGPGDTLAHAFFPGSGDGGIHFDEDELFTDGVNNGINYLWVATHEIGHAIGIEHTPVFDAVMYPFYKGYKPNFQLHEDDINAARQLFGNPVVITTPTPVCVDNDSKCYEWKEYCGRHQYVNENCKKTCGCPVGTLPPITYPPGGCYDKDHNCYHWKSSCGSHGYVIENCKKTCGTCS